MIYGFFNEFIYAEKIMKKISKKVRTFDPFGVLISEVRKNIFSYLS